MESVTRYSLKLVRHDVELFERDPRDGVATACAHFAWKHLVEAADERIFCFSLAPEDAISGYMVLGSGGRSCTESGVREVIRAAVMMEADEIVVAHNHPIGDSALSMPDKYFAVSLYKACLFVDIPLRGFAVVASNGMKVLEKNDLVELDPLEGIR